MGRLIGRPNPLQCVTVTEVRTNRGRRLKQHSSVMTRTRRPTDRRSRPQRWADATNVLLVLQAEYVDWLAALPDSLRDSPTAEALEAIADLDLTALAEIMPPRGYGRD